MLEAFMASGSGFPARYRFQVVREAGLPLMAFALAILLPLQYLVAAFVITGQAHFLITYIYQYRGRRMTSRYLVVALILSVVALLYFFFSGDTLPILLLTSVVFSAHFARDEMTLHDEPLDLERISTIAGFVFLFTATVIGGFFEQFSWMLPVAAGLVIVLTAGRVALGRTLPSYGEGYLWLIEFLAFILGYIRHLPASILAIIILLHVTNWYIAYGLRVAPHAERKRRYWRDVAWTLGLCAVLYVLFVWKLSFLFVFFLVGPFYAWSIAHIVLSYVATARART
jgi:hypothetical protein